MYLKNLTVLGFKSFPEKTSLDFGDGITAIVGPNGCGKSNVADAVRWVLGEQSAKALRGGEMADVIFSGTDRRKPLAMAEVSLTIGDVEQDRLQAAGVELEYNEVTLTRRVFRDGGSEYLLNQTGCRLKDIQQLFMGTGVGRTSYSIMAQGNITQLLSSKPEERRLVFEEAAGITKYKAQKKESLRKLDSTEQNLDRVSDRLREVKRQMGSLQRQAGKARRYKKVMDELQFLETQLARHQYEQRSEELEQSRHWIETVKAEAASCTEAVEQGESEINALRGQLAQLDEQIAEKQRESHDIKSRIEHHQSRIQFNEERLQELADQKAKAESDIAHYQERYQQTEQEAKEAQERLDAIEGTLGEYRQKREEQQERLRALDGELQAEQETVRQVQEESMEKSRRLSQIRNELNRLDSKHQSDGSRLEKLESEKAEAEEEWQRLEARLQSFEEQVATERRRVETQRETVESRQQRLEEVQQQIQERTAEQERLIKVQAETRSQMQVLEQLEAEHQGFSQGTLTALKEAERVLGSLADQIRVPEEYTVAIEAALGHYLQLVITEDIETTREILEYLTAHGRGRASFAPLDLEVPDRDRLDETVSWGSPGGGVPALWIVEADPRLEGLMRALLGQTIIVDDLAAATQAWEENDGRYDVVTRRGELISRHGLLTGGRSGGDGDGSSILARKNQIAELKRSVQGVQREIEAVTSKKEELQRDARQLQSDLRQAQSELHSQEVGIAALEGEYKELENSRGGLQRRLETIRHEMETLTAQRREESERRREQEQQKETVDGEAEEIQARLDELNAKLESLQGEREEASAALTETKVALASEEERVQSLRNQQAPLRKRLEELERLIEQRRQEAATAEERRGQAAAEIEESRQEVASLETAREEMASAIAELQSQRAQSQRELSERDESLQRQRRQQSDLQQRQSQVEVDLAEKRMALQNLRDRIQQKYQVDLDEVRPEPFRMTSDEQGGVQTERLDPEQATEDAAEGGPDWDTVSRHVEALQKRIDEIGAVNLAAIEEYEETEQHYQFLSGQYEDLVKAKEQLLEVINRINNQTREMFTDTFNKVRANFQALFQEVFAGGKADLRLINEGDVLESGIEIVARPPGKQLQSIGLLSGGEQTMTAVALLFSIYEVKPSPFCVLDELDAPLDEANVNRFVRVLQRYLKQSQFIIITHNKRTIGMADVLYGITMQERGVSKVVSVKFHKEHESEETEAQPLDEPASEDSIQREEDTPHDPQEVIEMESSE